MLKESFKQQRHDDDLNQPLSVQPWGRDGDKRRYWLVEGQDDTHFRLYRESNPLQKRNTWRSIAGTIDELRAAGERLGEDASQASRRLRDRIMQAIPRFEASEEVSSSERKPDPLGKILIPDRRESAGIIEMREKPNSRAPNWDSHSTKAGPVGSVSDIHSLMKKKEGQMLLRLDDRTGILASQLQQSQLDLHSLLVDAKLDLELEALMAKLC